MIEQAQMALADGTVSGWFIPNDSVPHARARPVLVLQVGNQWHAVAGKRIHRPDVATSAISRTGKTGELSDLGFLFEFSTRSFEGTSRGGRILYVGPDGSAQATPFFTFS